MYNLLYYTRIVVNKILRFLFEKLFLNFMYVSMFHSVYFENLILFIILFFHNIFFLFRCILHYFNKYNYFHINTSIIIFECFHYI